MKSCNAESQTLCQTKTHITRAPVASIPVPASRIRERQHLAATRLVHCRLSAAGARALVLSKQWKWLHNICPRGNRIQTVLSILTLSKAIDVHQQLGTVRAY
jgi:hypothetical protein